MYDKKVVLACCAGLWCEQVFWRERLKVLSYLVRARSSALMGSAELSRDLEDRVHANAKGSVGYRASKD